MLEIVKSPTHQVFDEFDRSYFERGDPRLAPAESTLTMESLARGAPPFAKTKPLDPQNSLPDLDSKREMGNNVSQHSGQEDDVVSSSSSTSITGFLLPPSAPTKESLSLLSTTSHSFSSSSSLTLASLPRPSSDFADFSHHLNKYREALQLQMSTLEHLIQEQTDEIVRQVGQAITEIESSVAYNTTTIQELPLFQRPNCHGPLLSGLR